MNSLPRTRVLHVIKSLGRGGAEMLLPETLKLHDQDRFEFHYLYFLPWKNQMVSAIENAGGMVTCLAAKNNLSLLLQYRKIARYCRERQIDLIHAHLPWAGFASRLVHRRTGIPLVYTEHNLQDRYQWLTKTINRGTFNWQTMALGVSQDVTDSITQRIAPRIPVKTLLNAVNVDSFQRSVPSGQAAIRRQLNIPADAFVIGTTAVFRFQKRLDLWLEIMRKAVSVNPRIYGVIVGAGPLEAELLQKHRDLELGDRVVFAGLQTEVKPYYEAMDCFMMSSSFEGLPIALLEAMSMECAIVATNAGGIKQVIRPGVDGLTREVDDWSGLTDDLLRLVSEPGLLGQLQQNARQRVVREFSMGRMVREIEEVYANLVQR